jgi:DNA-binding IclR family transcriptional regulator
MKQSTAQHNAIEKALEILMAFNAGAPRRGVRDLSAQLGYSPATVQRILKTLKAYGFVAQDEQTRSYRLGGVYYRFLHTLQQAHPITEAALARMQRLALTTRETVHLNIVDGDQRLCIETVEPLQPLKASMPIGSRSPLYAGASSKCLLAFSDDTKIEAYLKRVSLEAITPSTITGIDALRRALVRIREQGYALSQGEHNPGLGAMSVPVFNHRGMLSAALSLAIPEIRYADTAHRQFCLAELLRCAQRLSTEMGYRADERQRLDKHPNRA